MILRTINDITQSLASSTKYAEKLSQKGDLLWKEWEILMEKLARASRPPK